MTNKINTMSLRFATGQYTKRDMQKADEYNFQKLQDEHKKYNFVSEIESTKDTHKLAVMLKCDYPSVNKELVKLSTKRLEQIARAKKYN